MSRFQMCPASIAMGNHVCPEWRAEDAARLLRLLITPVKIALVALLLGVAIAVSFQWAQPFSFGPGATGAGHYAVQPTTRTGAADQHVQERAEAFLAQRGVYGLRALQGVAALAKQHSAGALEHATAMAKNRGVWRLRDLRRLLSGGDNVVQVDFLDTHPLIRPLTAYRLEALSQA